MTMSTQTLREAARQMAETVLIDSIRICNVGEPITVGANVTRDLDFHSDWAEVRRNYLLDPQAKTVGTGGWLAAGGFVHAIVDDILRATRNSSAAAATYINRNRTEMPRGYAGDVWSFSLEMRSSIPQTVTLGFIQNNLSTAFNAVNVDLTTEWVRYSMTGALAAAWVGQILSPRVGLSTSSSPNGSWIEYREADLEFTATPGSHVDGDLVPDGDLLRTRWLGGANQSISVLETRTITEPIPGLVQHTTLENAVESRSSTAYSVKVAQGTPLRAGQAIEVISCVMEPELEGKILLLDKVSLNGLAMLRKAVASESEIVNQEGKGVLGA